MAEPLAADGLAGETIVFFFSDHGMGLPRGKRCLFDSGLRIPLLIRFPEKWAHSAPGKPGSSSDRLGRDWPRLPLHGGEYGVVIFTDRGNADRFLQAKGLEFSVWPLSQAGLSNWLGDCIRQGVAAVLVDPPSEKGQPSHGGPVLQFLVEGEG